MANAFSTPTTLPDPLLDYLPGFIIKASEIGEILETLNYSIAEQHAEQVVHQTFEDGICASSETTIPQSGGNDIPMCSWDIPIASDQHTTATIYVRGYYEAAATGGDVIFESEGSTNSQTIALPLQGAAAENDFSLQTTLDIEDAGSGYDTINMYLTTDNVAGDAVIVEVFIETDALSSPLATLSHSGAVPFGTATLDGPDYSLPASRGQQIIDTITVLRGRERHFLSASAIDTNYNANLSDLNFADSAEEPFWETRLVNGYRPSRVYTIGNADTSGLFTAPYPSVVLALGDEVLGTAGRVDEPLRFPGATENSVRIDVIPRDPTETITKISVWGY